MVASDRLEIRMLAPIALTLQPLILNVFRGMLEFKLSLGTITF